MGHNEFIECIKKDIQEEELYSIEDRLSTFPITNRGIQIRLLLHPDARSRSLFRAQLPCRRGPWGPPVSIPLALWESNYYRCNLPRWVVFPPDGPLQLRQVHLRYQDLPHRNTTFKIDDSTFTENGFTCSDVYPTKFTGNTFTLNNTNSLCNKIYSNGLTNHHFAMGLGQSFDKDWIHVISNESHTEAEYIAMLVGMPEHAQHINKAHSGAERYGQVCIMQTRLPRTTRIFRISSVMWKSPRVCEVKLEVFHDPGFSGVSSEWTAFDVNVGSSFCTSQWH